MKFKLGDQVTITAGKDSGKSGEIIKLFPQKHRVTVKGVNLYKRHLKSREGIQGGIFSIERSLPTANVALLCPSCKKPTRIGFLVSAQGEKTRICKKCQAPLVKSTAKKKK